MSRSATTTTTTSKPSSGFLGLTVGDIFDDVAEATAASLQNAQKSPREFTLIPSEELQQKMQRLRDEFAIRNKQQHDTSVDDIVTICNYFISLNDAMDKAEFELQEIAKQAQQVKQNIERTLATLQQEDNHNSFVELSRKTSSPSTNTNTDTATTATTSPLQSLQ